MATLVAEATATSSTKLEKCRRRKPNTASYVHFIQGAPASSLSRDVCTWAGSGFTSLPNKNPSSGYVLRSSKSVTLQFFLIGPRELTGYTDCATLIEECKANVVRRISIPSKAKRNPLKYWRYYIVDMKQSIGVEKRPSFTCHEFHPRLRHIQVPKYRSRQIRLRQVVSAMGKPTAKSIFEFDSEMVYIDSK
uniref:Uncharacterized protein n=1 Tax=Vitis vinifera TaxID=29760 RepID=A5AJB2_VITVI|nr:hypothetical protein VITISV_039304 [Vitis vinifera]